MTPSKSTLEITNNSIKRFSAGAIAGLLISAIQWGSYVYFMGDPIPLGKGLIFCLGMSIICGLIILKWGYKTIENLLQLLG
jgi:hypothetical protein